jgi:hypothetical protein
LSARLEGRPALRSELRVEDKVRDERCGHTRREPNFWLSANYVDGWERVKKGSAPLWRSALQSEFIELNNW